MSEGDTAQCTRERATLVLEGVGDGVLLVQSGMMITGICIGEETTQIPVR